jgi:hypothetical protein
MLFTKNEKSRNYCTLAVTARGRAATHILDQPAFCNVASDIVLAMNKSLCIPL